MYVRVFGVGKRKALRLLATGLYTRLDFEKLKYITVIPTCKYNIKALTFSEA